MKKSPLFISPSFLFPLLLLFWKSPFDQILLFLLSVSIHEAGHLLAIYLSGEKAIRFSLSVTGAEITTSSRLIPYRKEIFIYLAGPIGNFIGAGLSFFLLRIDFTKEGMFFFFCNSLLALFNLLPIPGLDGERALFSLLCLFFDMEKVEKICNAVGKGMLALVFLASLFLLVKEKNPSLLFMSFSLIAEQKKKETSEAKKTDFKI